MSFIIHINGIVCIYSILYSVHCYGLNHGETFTYFKHDKRTIICASLLSYQLGRKNERKKKMERTGADTRPDL